jgi:ferritin-like metal-binding protein YciE
MAPKALEENPGARPWSPSQDGEVDLDPSFLKNDRAEAGSDDYEASTQDPSVIKRFPFTASDFESSVDYAEFELRIREFVMQLVNPHINKTAVIEKDLLGTMEKVHENAGKLIHLQNYSFRADAVMAQLETFRTELAKWDRERKGAHVDTVEQLSTMRIELDIARGDASKADAQFHAVDRTVDRATSELLKLQERFDVLSNTVEVRIAGFSKVVNDVKSSMELKMNAIETNYHRVSDRLWNESSSIDKLAASIKSARDAVEGLQRQVELMQQEKAAVVQVNQLSEEVQEKAQETSTSITGLREIVDGFMGSIKQHFATATETMAANSTKLLEEIRQDYKRDLGQAAQLRDEVNEFMSETENNITRFEDYMGEASAKADSASQSLCSDLTDLSKRNRIDRQETDVLLHQLQATVRAAASSSEMGVQRMEQMASVLGLLVENGRLFSALSVQDNTDRGKVALMGYPREGPKTGDAAGRGAGTSGGGGSGAAGPSPRARSKHHHHALKPGSDPVAENGGISLDPRCLSCSGQSGTTLSAFKMACLQYKPGPVAVPVGDRTIMYSRAELLDMQSNLLKEAHDALSKMPSHDTSRAAAMNVSRAPSRMPQRDQQHTPGDETPRSHGRAAVASPSFGSKEPASVSVRMPPIVPPPTAT